VTAVDTPIDQDAPEWRRLDAVALVVQAEAAILLLSPAIALLVRDDAPDPRPALMALWVAPVLWRLGHGVANASRVAIGILLALVFFHLISINGPTIDPVDVIVVAIEGIAVGVAVVTMRRHQPPVRPGWNRQLVWQTVVPIALAVAWTSYARRIDVTNQPDYVTAMNPAVRWLALMLIGTAIWLIVSTRFVPRVVRAFTGAPWKSVASSPARPKIRWTAAPWLDLVAAVVIGAVSWWTLARFLDLSSGPDVMLVPGVLLFPLTSLFGLAVAVAWAVSAWAHHTNRVWARRPRAVAMFGSAILVLIVGPFAFAVLKAFLKGSL
jgi:hypothetical protein